MATENQMGLSDLSFEAGADLSAKQFFFVKMSANNKVILCAAATDKPIGVLQNKPTSGQTAKVRSLGVSKVSADGTLAAGDLIGTSADGQADPKVPGTDTTEFTVGHVLIGAAAGELGTAAIDCHSPARAA